MAETGDWRNLAGFLEGLRGARRGVKGWQMEKMVRRACGGGRLGVVNDCLRRVQKTGMGLWDLRVSREVMWGALGKCGLEGWSREGVERATRFADNVWELMADPRHTWRMAGVTDPKRRPEILGILVLLHACRVALFGEGKDEVAAVERHTQSMLKFWDSQELDFAEGDWNDANYKLLMWAPVWRGMTVAQKVLGPSSPLGKELERKLCEELGPLMERGQAVLSANLPEEGTRRGLKVQTELSQLSV